MGNRLLDYAEYFNSQRALWHVHTNYTDGKCSIEEILDLAVARGIEFVCFIEHIRRRPTYSPEAFRDEIMQCSAEREIEAIVGFEAKLLHDGTVNIPDQDLDAFIFLAEHGNISPSKEEYVSILLEGLSNPVVSGWVHPGLFAKRMGWTFSSHESEQIASVMRQNELVYEMNKRYRLPVPSLSDALKRVNIPFFTGVDFHQKGDLEDSVCADPMP
jgi:putative hydrolase